MKGNYEPDTFTENDVLHCLETAGLQFTRKSRYILTQCPLHKDRNPSAQIYTDDFFVNCHATCGRFHITKAFPELRNQIKRSELLQISKAEPPMTYKEYELIDDWRAMPLIPRDHILKGLPLEILDDLGWRWNKAKNSYFIPYFDKTRNYIPFAQWRHLSGERRFTFLKEAKPIMYGLWNLDNPKLFLVEGTSDAAVLEYCAVPWIAAPSASSGALCGRLADFCAQNGIELIFAGDVDAAGLKLRQALDEAGHGYRIKQPPKNYKDWGEFFEAEGQEAITKYCFEELFQEEVLETDLDRIEAIFPGSRVLNVINT